ncbi:hypothetical protein L6452_14350 [Arctium lappa]|uniref:Uncharacterized protein n=1 Tax=Arctium lappa TaxID=4217 RepID=A0ACB9CL10_ARCLA|nr:hypothetical protein L6452_14350 [Arctium lappa]
MSSHHLELLLLSSGVIVAMVASIVKLSLDKMLSPPNTKFQPVRITTKIIIAVRSLEIEVDPVRSRRFGDADDLSSTQFDYGL